MSPPAAIDAQLPGDLERAVAERVRRAQEADVAGRIGRRDGTLWAPAGTPEVADRLGWVDIAERLAGEAPGLMEWAAELREAGFADALLLGMGGSSLAPEVFRQSFGEPEGALRLHVLDTTEPRTIAAVGERLDPERTLVLVSTKSGGTIETLSLFKHFWAWSAEESSRFVAITDPGSGLADLAGGHGFRRTFLNDPEIGGRYSALSLFGLVPAALAGVDVTGQLRRTADAARSWSESGEGTHPGVWLGSALGELAARGRDKVTWVVDAPIGSFGLWVEQLVAESTGKEGRGALPIADEPLEDPAALGPDRVFVHLRNDRDPDDANARQVAAATRAGHPALVIGADGAADLGRLFLLAEHATAVSGWVLGINPFDQPNVQEAKDNTQRALEGGTAAPDEGGLGALADGLEPPAYLAVMGYLPYDDATDAAIARLRSAVLRRRGVATTWGYGPRFLHSTGQYHKGGPATGRFLQLVHDGDDDVAVPGEPFGFRRLISAQADGDLQTLRSHGLPAVRVRLSADGIAPAIDELTATLEGVL